MSYDKSFEEMAAKAVDWWRANDGGLTMAADDVIFMGAQIDRLFACIDSGQLTPEEVQEMLYEWQFNTRTGTESDVIGEALEYLHKRYLKK
jgi:hypothetical protein